jgi:hypothetical protein
MKDNKLLEAINFAFQTVIEDERFFDSTLTPEDAETIVHHIVTTQFPKCFKSLKEGLINTLEKGEELNNGNR